MRRYDWYGGEESERNPDAEAEALKAKVHAGITGGCGLTVLLAVVGGACWAWWLRRSGPGCPAAHDSAGR